MPISRCPACRLLLPAHLAPPPPQANHCTFCYTMSRSFRTDYHTDFTCSMSGTADSSSRSAQLIIWRTRRHHAEDNATTRRHGRRSVRWQNGGVEATSSGCHCVSLLCADTAVVERCQPLCPPGETRCGCVELGFSSDYLQGRPRGYLDNGHIQRSFQYSAGDHKYAVAIHSSYR